MCDTSPGLGTHVSADELNRIVLSTSCAMGSNCPVGRLIELRNDFLDMLERQSRRSKQHREKLQAALFVKRVLENGVASHGKQRDFLEAFRHAHLPGEAPVLFESTVLHRDLEKLDAVLKGWQRRANEAAQRLIDYLSRGDVQEHLRLDHAGLLCPGLAKSHYEVGDTSVLPADAKRPEAWLEKDHVLALVTEQLGVTAAGEEFFDVVLGIAEPKPGSNLTAIKDFWGRFKKAKSASEPMAKFLHQAVPGAFRTVQSVVNEGLARSVDDVLDSPRVSLYLDAIEKRTGAKLRDWLRERSNVFATHSNVAILKLNARLPPDEILSHWAKVDGAELDGAAQKLDSAWGRITFGSLSFGLAMAKVAKDWRSAGFRDWVGAIEALAGLAQEIGDDMVAAFARKNGAVTASRVASAAQRLGFLGALLGMAFGVLDAHKEMKKGDVEAAVLALAGVGISAIGFIGLLAGSSMVAGVGAIAALALALLAKPKPHQPLVDFLRKTHWGTDPRFGLAETRDRFYEEFFTLRVSVPSFDASHPIVIEGNALGLSSTLSVQWKLGFVPLAAADTFRPGDGGITRTGQKQRRGLVEFVDGVPSSGSDSRLSFYLAEKQVKIFEWTQIWPFLTTDGKTSYSLAVGFDPDDDGDFEIEQQEKVRLPAA